MSVQFKYFKITEQSTLDEIENCIVSIGDRKNALLKLAKSFGAEDVLQFTDGGVAAFNFYSNPDKSSWKKSKHGHLPKAKSNEQKLLSEIPYSKDYRDIIKKYNLGHEMILGEPKAGSMGFPMHSSHIKGNRKTGFYAITVPYQGEFDRDIHESLVEIKEWELVKGMDAGES